MTKFESRPLAGDAEFEALGHPVAMNRVPDRTAPSRPVPDLPVGNGSRPAGEPRFHSLNEQDFDVVAVIGATGRFIFVSASAERLFGYDISNVVGLDAFGLFDSLSVEPVRALFSDLVARRRLSVSLEMRTVRADGKPIDLEVVAANHLDDPIGGIVVNIRDITEHKNLEQRVLDVDRRQATIIESLADGVMMVDADGTVVRVNEAFEVMFEAPRVRLIGRRIGDLMDAARSRGLEVIDVEGETVDGRADPDRAGPAARPAVGRGRARTPAQGAAGRCGSGATPRPCSARTARSPVRWPRSATSPRRAGRRSSSAGRSSSSRCCWTRSKRASWLVTTRGASPCSTRPHASSTGSTTGRRPDRHDPRPTRDCADRTGRPWPSVRTR